MMGLVLWHSSYVVLCCAVLCCCCAVCVASQAVICVANRLTDQVLETDTMRSLETAGGRAVLEAITKFELDDT